MAGSNGRTLSSREGMDDGSSASAATLWPASSASTSISRFERRTGPSALPCPLHYQGSHQTSASEPAGRGPKRFPSARLPSTRQTTCRLAVEQTRRHGSDGHALADDDAASPAMHDLDVLAVARPLSPWPVFWLVLVFALCLCWCLCLAGSC